MSTTCEDIQDLIDQDGFLELEEIYLDEPCYIEIYGDCSIAMQIIYEKTSDDCDSFVKFYYQDENINNEIKESVELCLPDSCSTNENGIE